MRTLMAIAVAAGMAPSFLATAEAQESPDFRGYMQQIRPWGMTEGTHASLFSVASVITGGTTLSFSKDGATGTRGMGYRGSACSLPGTDTAAVGKWQQSMRVENEVQIRRLRPLADLDGSEFVSTEEGGKLRQSIEFGYFADHLLNKERLSATGAAMAAGNKPQDFADRVERCNEAARKFNAGGELKLPLLPVDLNGECPRVSSGTGRRPTGC